MDIPSGLSRRDFVKSTLSAAAALGALGATRVHAQGSDTMTVALVGCGGRGRGALSNHLEAARHLGLNVKVVATADAFRDRAVEVGGQHSVPPEQCFEGFEAYKEVLKTNPDVVILATPPGFRPVHYEAAVKAGRNIFMEKPVAVDAPGARRMLEVNAIAEEKGLKIAAGTQRRHQSGYLGQAQALREGAAGRILGGTVSWLGGRLWYKNRNDGEGDASYMVRNWTSFAELSGDHIVEQHVHNIDVANWFIGKTPSSAIGFGRRARRITGNQFDFFSVDFNYGDGIHIHSACRQINGCYNRVGEVFRTDKGIIYGGGKINLDGGGKVALAEFPEHGGPYVQEHVDLLTAITKGEELNETQNVVESTLSAIMGRISCYTGQLVRWTDLTQNTRSPFYSLTLSPTALDFEKGEVVAPEDDVAPIPGKA